MTGLTDYTSKNLLNWITGGIAEPSLPSVFLALFTAVGVDAGTGFTEVSGGAYARVQVAGGLTAGAAFTTSSATITLSATAPAWLLALGTNGSGVEVYDTTNNNFIGTVSSISGTTVTLTANAAHASTGSSDSLVFTAFSAASGSQPSSIQNNASITFPQATANWGTVVAFGLYDAVTSGNFLEWDFLGNFQWLPASVSSVGSGNGGVFTTHAHGYANGDPVVVTVEYGGTLPTVTQGQLTSYLINFAANVATDTYTLSSSSSAPSSANAVWTSTTGDLMARKLVQQSVPQNVTASFAASAITLLAA